ncbi:HEAT repeat domain-containing protein [Haloarchaeobius litoreus]|uniref:HEAT repeat domain-containing protein n=1 Tax=Haloarchaeobius litoreus TaxID=755306 RepID=A0ABD6DN38_9EURY|nr:HEAT repeat domain-containing protein [Haloarchaeobius litoreus]
MGLLSGSDDTDRAEELCELARDDPAGAVAHVDELRDLLAAGDATTRASAADALYHIAGAEPEALVDCVDALITQLDDDDASARRRAADALAATAAGAPRTFSAWVESLAPSLSTGDPYVRAAVASVFAQLAASGPSTVLDAVEGLRDATTDDEEWDVRTYATGALADVATRYPEEVLPVVDDAVANAREPVPALQTASIDLLAAVAVSDPATVPEVDELFAELVLDAPTSQRLAAAYAIGRVGVEHPDRIPEALSALTTAIGDDDDRVSRAAATAFVTVATEYSGSVTIGDDLRQRLWWLADDIDAPVEQLLESGE